MKAEFEKNQRGLCREAIPNGWRVALLKDLSLLKISNGAFNDPKCVGSGYKLINIADLYQGPKIRTENLGRLSLRESEYKTFKVSRGDLFFTRSSLKKEGIAHCNVFLSDEENVVYECHMMRVRPNPELVDSKFLQEFCLAGPARDYFISHGKTTTMTTIDQGSIGGLPVLLPPLPEQQKIAAVLTAVDDKLDVIARQIEATQTLKQGLMQTLFSRGVGTQDATGRWIPHTEFKDSELGEIPEGWLITTLGAICNGALQTGPFGSQLHAAEYQDEGIPVLMPKDLLKCRANLSTAARIAPERAEELAKHKLVSGDLLFSRRGDVARFALIDEQSAGALCGTGCLKAKPSAGYSSAYIAHLLQLDVVRAWLEQNAVGQTMPNMNTAILASLPLVAPANKQEQEEIAGILDSVDAKTRLLFSKQLHFQTLKRGLMQKLLTGEWRVKLDSSSGTA